MLRHSVACVLGLMASVALAVAAQPPTEPPATRAPIPAPAAVTETSKLIRELFKADYAKKKVSDQLALARKLLSEGNDTKNDPVGKFVLYREARDVAAKAGDVPLALEAAAATSRDFEISPIEAKLSALEVADKASAPAKDLIEAALAGATDAVRLDDYPSAGRFLKIAAGAAARGNVPGLAQVVASRAKEVDGNRKLYESLEPDRSTLAMRPDDASAAERVGRYLCLVKGDWLGGLPLLAKGAHPGLKGAAAKDLAGATSAATRVEVGDAWWDVADGLDGAAKMESRLRACHWYQEAVGELTGLNKVRTEKRLAEMAKVIEERANRITGGWTVLLRSVDPTIWNTNVNTGRDHFAIPLSQAPKNTKYLKVTEQLKKTFVIIEMTYDSLNKQVESNGYGWNGTCKDLSKGYHLGIYDLAWTQEPQGAIMVRHWDGKFGCRGWGFGHRAFIGDVQGYTWNGQPIDKIAFEIAVKSTSLTPNESKYLLKKAK